MVQISAARSHEKLAQSTIDDNSTSSACRFRVANVRLGLLLVSSKIVIGCGGTEQLTWTMSCHSRVTVADRMKRQSQLDWCALRCRAAKSAFLAGVV